MKTEKEIEYLEFNQTKSSPCVLFFHGYGANAQDLSGFHTLQLPVSCRWIFPNGFLKLGVSHNAFGGRAWFPLKMNGANGRLYETDDSLEYLDKHCQQLLTFIQSLHLDSNQVILGGFSQGAVIALNLALKMNPPPLALIMMSGTLFPADVLYNEKQRFSTSGSFFQCHGTVDPLLSHSEAGKAHEFLRSLNWKGDFVSFEGGHEIPHAILLQVQEFISRKLL